MESAYLVPGHQNPILNMLPQLKSDYGRILDERVKNEGELTSPTHPQHVASAQIGRWAFKIGCKGFLDKKRTLETSQKW
jgi:hypothetical protein